MSSQLLTNQWFGKAIGFTAAFVLAPRDQVLLSFAIILGIGAGHLFDIWAARQTNPQGGSNATRKKQDRPEADTPYLQFLFTALGNIAKQSGVVSKDHIKLTESFIAELGLDRQGRHQAIMWFRQGKSKNHSLPTLARQARTADAPAKHWGSLTTQYMAQMAALSPTDEALAATVQFAGLLNIPPGDVAAAFGEAFDKNKQGGMHQASHHQSARHQSANHQGNNKPTSTAAAHDPLTDAYAELGIPMNTSMREVKTAYRRLISKHHPDKLGPQASKIAISQAEQRMVELRNALELIEASHH